MVNKTEDMKEDKQDNKEENLALLKNKLDVDLLYKVLSLFNYSITDFAQEIGVNRSYLSSVLNGKYPVTDELAVTIKKTLVKITRAIIKKTDNPETVLLQRAIAFINSLDPKYESEVAKIREEITSQVRALTLRLLEEKRMALCNDVKENIEDTLKDVMTRTSDKTELVINEAMEQIQHRISEEHFITGYTDHE